jgi:Protein of unknown function (DUF2844)
MAGCALVVALALPARAELGGTEDTVRVDQQRMRGALRVNRMRAYAMHEIRTESNAVVHEFVAPSGTVFAVTYHGPVVGESNNLLGSYSAALAQAMQTVHGGRHIGGPVIVRVGDVVYEASGHMRSFTVRAFLTSAIPEGVTREEIR